MSGDAEASGKAERLARKIWLLYAIATITAALVLLAIYVNAYDDYDVGERLRGLGRFTRRAMLILSFPISLPAGALAAGPLSGAFGCGDDNEPCAIFVIWQTLFVALAAQIVLLRLAIGRRWRQRPETRPTS
ncbi:hypothetical protein [Methylocystis echinoides]|uniref:hypothetical protein n=1 Tax=Methylocystis echinoides TaxID=29468 RepID=UPI00341D475E